jgi:hypothetical protein
MSNAFAPIVRARPNPIFGRPVHQGSPPFDYSPILLLKPFGFRIAPDTLSSGIRRATGSRSVLAVSGFRLRARLDFSIPSCSPGQRGITPAFGYSAPHPSAEGTSTPMIHALPSAHYEAVRPSALPRYSRLAVFAACASPLSSKRLVPAVPRKSPHPIPAPCTPVVVCPILRLPTDLSQEGFTLLVLTTRDFLTTRLRRVHFRSTLGHSPAQGLP